MICVLSSGLQFFHDGEEHDSDKHLRHPQGLAGAFGRTYKDLTHPSCQDGRTEQASHGSWLCRAILSPFRFEGALAACPLCLDGPRFPSRQRHW